MQTHRETNPLPEGYTHVDREVVEWDHPDLVITRLRLVSDPGYPWWDVSYCHGEVSGQPVRVLLPFDQLPKKNMFGALYKEAKMSGCYIRGLEPSNISTLC
jgi:hypothetical protein